MQDTIYTRITTTRTNIRSLVGHKLTKDYAETFPKSDQVSKLLTIPVPFLTDFIFVVMRNTPHTVVYNRLPETVVETVVVLAAATVVLVK